MFLIQSQTRAQAGAFMDWQQAANLVSSRWRTYLNAEPEIRVFVFASYMAALDAEEAAAADMAALVSPVAA
jgi:hypothetical protein